MKNVLLLALFTLILCVPPSSTAGAVAPKKPSDLRTVLGLPSSVPCPGLSSLRAVDLQQNPDGTTGPFSIPVGNVFIVTSFDTEGSGAVGTGGGAALIISDGTGGSSLIARCDGVAASNGLVSGSCTLPIGVPVKGGSTLCYTPTTSNVIVRGFMAKDK